MSGDDPDPGGGPLPADLRATRAEIDLDVLARNVELLRSGLSSGSELMAIVKANAYGHGALMVAATALAAGTTCLGVATVSEGRQLRAGGIHAPILVLSPVSPVEVPGAITARLELTIATRELLAAVIDASRRSPRPVRIHVKIDTGMHRYGGDPDLAIALARQVAATPSLRLAGLMTHFAAADEPDDRFTHEQAALFDRCLADLAMAGIEPERRHAANSAALLRDGSYHYDLVRAGIAMYGLRPSPDVALPAGVRPVMTVRSRVGRVHALAPGATVGYGRAYASAAGELAVLVPIGYADGYRRGLSNRAWMMVNGHRADIAGRVSMDQTVLRLPAATAVAVGDDVIVLGDGHDRGAPTAEQLAALLDTISYEIVTGISVRVPRHYLRRGRLVGIESLPHPQSRPPGG